MSLSRVKTWSPGDVLTAADLNAEFNNILQNPAPFLAGQTIGVADLTVGGTTHITALSATVKVTGAIDLDAGTSGMIHVDATTGAVGLGTTNVAGLSAGDVKVAGAATVTGLLTPVAGQILFPATQNASSNANTLDDYSEGTWTPSVGGNATYTTQSGVYTKIGNQVTVNCVLNINVLGTGSANSITGLPYAAKSTLTVMAPIYYQGAAASYYVLFAKVNGSIGGGTTITLVGITTTASTLLGNLANAIGNNTDLEFTLTYLTS